MTSHVVIVGADKGGVGKTTVSRTLLDYLGSKTKQARAFDTETPNGVLKRFFPNQSEIVDLTRSDGQMRVFDELNKAPITLIDIRAGLLSPSLQVLADIGLLDGVRDGSFRLSLFHIIGASIASFREIEATKLMLAGAKHYLVMNHINGASFFDWKQDVRAALDDADSVIQVPKLDELAAEHVEQLGVPFTDFVNDSAQSMVLRGYVRNWLSKVYENYDRTLTF